MKRKFSIVVIVCLVFTSPALTMAADFSLNVNGVPLYSDVRPVVEGRNVLLPLRAVAEALGAEVIYDEFQRTVTISKPALEARISPGKYGGIKNGSLVLFVTPPKIINDRIFVTREELTKILDVKTFLRVPEYSITVEN